MNDFYVIANSQKEACTACAQQIREYLENKGKVCQVRSSDEPVPRQVDCVLVLGGDGTLLRAARELLDRDLPLLGINMGTLGYLAEIEAGGVFAALDELIAGNYSIENRMLLSGEVIREGEIVMRDIALNDIVISRHGRLRVVDYNIEVDGTFLCSYRADGIILATPTGSTGYSLSAGGPIVSPDASLILLTAIAPHTLNSRTVILPEGVQITVEASGREFTEKDGANVTFDGSNFMALMAGDRIRVRRSGRQTRLIKIRRTSFVEILRKKMN